MAGLKGAKFIFRLFQGGFQTVADGLDGLDSGKAFVVASD